MSALSLIGLMSLVVAIGEIFVAYRLGIAQDRRGAGLVLGALVTAACGGAMWQTQSHLAAGVASVAQLVAIVSLLSVLRPDS